MAAERDAITDAFTRYGHREFDTLGDKYELRTHWAKIELPDDVRRLDKMRTKIREHYPVKEFNAVACGRYLDPYGVFSNALVTGLFR